MCEKTKEKKIDVYGIGNPLIDILAHVDEADLTKLGLSKGTMHLIDLEERSKILSHIDGKEITYRCGGSAPNTVIALSSFGVKTAIAGKIGPDEEGRQYLDQLARFETVSNLAEGRHTTGSSIILVTPDAERTMNTFLGANREFTWDDIDFELLEDAKYFYFTGYMWDTEPQKAAILSAVDFCNERNIKIVFDVADPFAVNRNREAFLDLIHRHVHLVFANCEEAKILFGKEDPAACAGELSAMVDVGVVKNGSKGSYVSSGSSLHTIPVNRVEAVDSTGAGDMYAAGFIYGLVNGFSHADCGLCASWLASRIVTQYGAQFREEKFDEINRAFRNGDWRF